MDTNTFLWTVTIIGLIWYFYQHFKNRGRPPGPLPLPFIGNLFQIALASSKAHIAFDKLSKKYGRIMSLKIGSDDFVVVSEPDIIGQILTLPETKDRPVNDFFLERNLYQNLGIGLANGENWATIRQYTMKNLRKLGFGKSSMESSIMMEIEEIISNINRKRVQNAGQCVAKPSELFMFINVNIVWSLVTGKRYGHQDPKMKTFLEISHQVFQSTNFAPGITLAFPILRRLFPKLSGKEFQATTFEKLHNFFRNEIAKHKMSESRKIEPNNFVEMFINTMESEEKTNPTSCFTEDQLVVLLFDLFQASDIIHPVICYAILFFTLHLDVQQRIQLEIDENVRQGFRPSLENKSRFMYTNAAIFETFRFANVTAIPPPRQVTRDFELNGFLFKKGVSVITNNYTLNRDKKLWNNPETFQPYHFITQNNDLDNQKFETMLLFGKGSRKCIGDTMALSVIFLLITSLLEKFTFEFVPGTEIPSTEPITGLLLTPIPFDVLIKPRNA